jgi:hypothetical protein
MTPSKSDRRAFPLEGIDKALRRAAIKARELSERTRTPLIVVKQGQIVDLRQSQANTE